VTLSDEDKKRQYDQCGTEEEFLRRQQGAGHNPFQHMNPDDIFREMFAGGGLPPEFAHIFGAAMGGHGMRGRGGRR
jgi:DnaJ-class molecular chaperone